METRTLGRRRLTLRQEGLSLMDKHYDPQALEAKWYPHWDAMGAFRGARQRVRVRTPDF